MVYTCETVKSKEGNCIFSCLNKITGTRPNITRMRKALGALKIDD